MQFEEGNERQCRERKIGKAKTGWQKREGKEEKRTQIPKKDVI